jgi:hypothetical protein
VAVAVPIMHFALRTTEPTRTACGGFAHHIYQGEAGQDEFGRRLQGQVVTTCKPCRRAMLWEAQARPRGVARPRPSSRPLGIV